MTRSQRFRFALLAGGLVFSVWGLVESIVQLAPIPWWPAVASHAAVAMGVYGLLGAVLTGAWGVTALRLDAVTFRVRSLAVGVLAMGYVLVGFHINRRWFATLTSPPSLVFTAAWTALLLWLVWRLRRARTDAPPRASDADGSWMDAILRRAALGVVVLAGLALALPAVWTQPARARAAQQVAAPPVRPHVLLMVLDTVRADHVSSNGYARPTTPSLDRVAREGVSFEQASTPIPWAPAHVSLLTGLYQSQHGTDAKNRKMDERAITLAERLRADGYQTLAVSNNGWFGRWARVDQGFDDFVEIWTGDRLLSKLTLGKIVHGVAGPLLTDENEANAPLTNRLIRRWLDRDHDTTKPFFIFINYFEPQFFYEPPEPYRSQFLDPSRRGLVRWRELRAINRNPPPVHLDDTTRAILTDLYDGEIAFLDARVGELLEDLRERGILDQTLVVITSDHGENLGDHGLVEHRTNLYETVLHVPLLMRYPAAFPAGTRVAAPVSLVDVVPTVLQLTRTAESAEQGAMLPGQSLVGARAGTRSDRAILAEDSASVELMRRFRPPFEERYFTRSLKSLRQGSWKFIWASDGQHELFDLSQDPGETTNLVAEAPEQARAMETQLQGFLGGLKPLPSQPTASPSLERGPDDA